MTNPGEDDSAYERQGDARRKFWIKPLQEIDPGVAQAFLTPERLCCYFYIFQHATLNKTFTAKYNTILPRTPWDQNPRFTPRPKQDDKHRKPFYMRSAPHPPPPGVTNTCALFASSLRILSTNKRDSTLPRAFLLFVIQSLFCFIQQILCVFISVNRCSCNKEGLQSSVYRVYLVAAFL